MDATVIIAAIITGCLSLIGVVVTNVMSNRRIENKLVTAQAVTDVKIDNLAAEVRKHNNFASRMPVVEEQIKSITGRVHDLELAAKGDGK